MQYLGGKSRLARHLVAAMVRDGAAGLFWEPFCGGLSMSVALTHAFGPGLVSDGNVALISLYQAVRDGWDPPMSVTAEEYAVARRLPDTDPRKAFIGFGVSFAGKWFGGLAKSASRHDYCRAARNALLRDCSRVDPFVCDFLLEQPQPGLGFVYLDPPYAGTTQYSGMPAFDTDLFIHRARQWAEYCPVYVSEYSFPIGRIVWEGPSPSAGTLAGHRTERLYRL